jgi:hypothetical protein
MGVAMTLGGGAIYGSSTQKADTRVQTEAEFMCENYDLPQVLRGLGFDDTNSEILHDNQSAMLLVIGET